MGSDNPFRLVDADDSILVVIDVQDVFLDKLPADAASLLVGNATWLMAVARWKAIPMIVTAERADSQPTAPAVVEALPDGTTVQDKLVFGIAGQPDAVDALDRAADGRSTAVLVGLETDVCVLHSALGLLERGYRVAVVVDATGSPEPGHRLGLDRLRSAGVVLLDTKGLFYEWLRTVAEVDRFHAELPNMADAARVQL